MDEAGFEEAVVVLLGKERAIADEQSRRESRISGFPELTAEGVGEKIAGLGEEILVGRAERDDLLGRDGAVEILGEKPGGEIEFGVEDARNFLAELGESCRGAVSSWQLSTEKIEFRGIESTKNEDLIADAEGLIVAEVEFAVGGIAENHCGFGANLGDGAADDDAGVEDG